MVNRMLVWTLVLLSFAVGVISFILENIAFAYVFFFLAFSSLAFFFPYYAVLLQIILLPLEAADYHWKFALKMFHVAFPALVLGYFIRGLSWEKFVCFIKNLCKNPLAWLVAYVIITSVVTTLFIPENPLIMRNAFVNRPFMRSFTRAVFFGVLVLTSATVYWIANKKPELYSKFVRWHFLVVSIVSLIGIFAYLLHLTGGFTNITSNFVVDHRPSFGLRTKSILMEPIYFAIYLLTSIPLLISSTFNPELISRKKAIAHSIIQIFALMISVSRSGYLAFFGSVGFLLIAYRSNLANTIKRYWQFRLGIVVFVLACLLSVVLLPAQIGDFILSNTIHRQWSLQSRWLGVVMALGAFSQHPIIGIGWENFIFYSGARIYPEIFADKVYAFPEVGVMYARLLAELGIIGTVLLLFALYQISRPVFQNVKNMNSSQIGSLAVIIALLIQFFFFSNMALQYVWIALGLCYTALNIQTPSPKTH